MQLLTANYNAEYGCAAGGHIRIVTKSGQKDFHGDFYEYFRNSGMEPMVGAGIVRSGGRTSVDAPVLSVTTSSDTLPAVRYSFLASSIRKRISSSGHGQEWVRFRQEQLNQAGSVRVPSETILSTGIERSNEKAAVTRRPFV